MELGRELTYSDSVSKDYTIEDPTHGRANDIGAGNHGTRPPVPVADDSTRFQEPESDKDAVCGCTGTRPRAAPSISGNEPPLYLSLPPPENRRKRKGCLKAASPLSSPSLQGSSPESSPFLSYANYCHTLGKPGSTPEGFRHGSGSSTPKKCVSWCSENDRGLGYLEEVYPADEWDRTPTEPARTPLSYKDILELKAIQRSLPCAQQLPDPFTGKPVKQFLSTVPIALLPLLPDSAPSTPLSTPNLSPNSSAVGTPHGSGENTPSPPSSGNSRHGSPRSSPEQSTCSSPLPSPRISPYSSPNRSPNRSPERNTPVHAHAPKVSSPLVPSYPPSPAIYPPIANTHTPPTPRPRAKPTFTFLPLLDTPITSPTSSGAISPARAVDLTPQALDAALGNLCGKDPSFTLNEEDSPPPTPALTVTSLNGDSCSEVDTELSDIGEDIPFGVMFRKDADGSYQGRWRNKERTKTNKPKKNVIYINGEAIDLDEDDNDGAEEEKAKSPAPSPVETPPPSSNVIYINGEPCCLDDPAETAPSKPKSLSPPRISSSPPSASVRPRTPSPEPERKHRSPVSPFHNAHPNLPRARTPSPDSDRKPRSQAPISPFHRAHPNLKLRSLSPSSSRG
ncbi:hypothetical protein V5O48_017659 [Marasmius crinis-equi]|uniref:Uncharacterized protein n=1 Tax=Marasmius crinis-equi TaxID=585013 RepID=A0ABR3ENH3_9AGAR